MLISLGLLLCQNFTSLAKQQSEPMVGNETSCSNEEISPVFIPEPSDIPHSNAQIIAEIKHHFEGKSLVIVAKGPSAKYVKHAVGINQAVLLTDKTFLFANDFPSFMGIETIIPQLKYVFLPDFPHTSDVAHLRKANRDKDYRFTCRQFAKLGFTGKFFVYQIQTSFNTKTEETLQSVSSTDVPVRLLIRHFNISSIHTYGYNRGPGYHPFMDLVKGNMMLTKYDNETAPLAREILAYFEDQKISYLDPDTDAKSVFDPIAQRSIYIN